MYSKSYYNLIATDDCELTGEEICRKRFCQALPQSVVTTLLLKVGELSKEVMRLEQQRDEIIDFLNGCRYADFLQHQEDQKDGDTN